MRPGLNWELVDRWWNGSFGRLNQRRIWLFSDGRSWRVQARAGDADSDVWERDYDNEPEARNVIAAMIERTADDGWKHIPPA